MLRHFKPALLLSTVTLLAACSTTGPSGADAAQANLPAISDEWVAPKNTAYGNPVDWIERLDDPRLTTLIKEAEAQNPNIQASQSEISRARSLVRLAGASLSPSVGVALNGENKGLVEGGSSSQASLGLAVNWELDLWGRLASRRDAATQNMQAIEADFRGAQNLLAASVAQAYLIGIEAGLQRDIAKADVSALSQITDIAQDRYDAGLATADETALAQSDLAASQARLIELEGAQRSALRALEGLLGRYPSAKTDIPAALPAQPASPPAGLPSGILERRPDLIAAERRVAAAFNALDEAKAARLPSISLTGEFGGASSDLSDLLSPASLGWKAASSILAPIWAGGALQAQVDLKSAEAEIAISLYTSAALNAFTEVENALDRTAVLERQIGLFDVSYARANEAYNIGKARYEEGETDLLDVLTLQRRVLAAQTAQASAGRQHLQQYIALSLALGGDWQTTPDDVES